nr:MAG TPA: hypothetical protein [Caudoviricetes sp.]
MFISKNREGDFSEHLFLLSRKEIISEGNPCYTV